MHDWILTLMGLSAPLALMADAGEGGGEAAAESAGAEGGDAGAEAAGGEEAADAGEGEGAAPKRGTMEDYIAAQHPEVAKARGLKAAGAESQLTGGDSRGGADGTQQSEQLEILKKKVGSELGKQLTEADAGLTTGAARKIASERQKRGYAEKEAQTLRERLARLEGVAEGKGVKLDDATKPSQQTQQDGDPEPKADDFNDPSKFDEAHQRWVVRDENRKGEAGKQVTQAEQRQQQALTAFNTLSNKIVDRARELFEDTPAGPLELTNDMGLGVVRIGKTDVDLAATVAHHLATHPDEHTRIAKLDDVGQQVEVLALGKELARAKGGKGAADAVAAGKERPAPPPAPRTAAETAPPLRRVAPSSGAPPTPYSAKSMDDYKRSRLAEIRK